MGKLFIRSQNKKRIIEANEINVEELKSFNANDNNNVYLKEKLIGAIIIVNNKQVGKFKSLDRALEVVDEIYYLLEKGNKAFITPKANKGTAKDKQLDGLIDIDYDVKPLNTNFVVYQIPLE